VKVAALLDLLKADGWYVVTIRGSRRQPRYPTKPGKVTLAGKPSDELHPKTAASVLWQARLRR
jgi:predicted RNA binding protein YcfA (HicA-like mRNA interferase family)